MGDGLNGGALGEDEVAFDGAKSGDDLKDGGTIVRIGRAAGGGELDEGGRAAGRGALVDLVQVDAERRGVSTENLLCASR